ncbi:hypothetical protein AKJ16_DCAP09088 [Drosera capensis]
MGGAEIDEVKTGEFFAMSMEMSEGTCFAWSMKQLGAMQLIEDEYLHTKSMHAREVNVVIQRASVRERSPKQILRLVKDRQCKAVQLQVHCYHTRHNTVCQARRSLTIHATQQG